VRRAGTDAADRDCICGPIMSGLATPADCALFGGACVPDSPVGACMVSSEGICRIWHQYGGRPDGPPRQAMAVPAGGRHESRRGDERIELKHGAGGRAMRALIEQVFLTQIVPLPGTVGAAAMDDGAAMPVGDEWLVVTTDAHVVHPVFFPGGDIGRLAIAGTVNDLAVMGATDVLGLACAVVIEEGYPQADLVRIQASIHAACREAGASIVTGDTKVMGRGEIDGIVLTTTGFG
jgi:hypothetical protein